MFSSQILILNNTGKILEEEKKISNNYDALVTIDHVNLSTNLPIHKFNH